MSCIDSVILCQDIVFDSYALTSEARAIDPHNVALSMVLKSHQVSRRHFDNLAD